MKKYSLVVIATLSLTACLGQGTKSEPMYCMPKRYADSVTRELLQKDQLVRIVAAQDLENAWVWAWAENLQTQVDSLGVQVTDTADLGEAKNEKLRKGRNTWRAIGLGGILVVGFTLYTKIKEEYEH